MQRFNAFIDISPANRELAHVNWLLDRMVVFHLIPLVCWYKIITFHSSFFVAFQLVLCYVIAPHSVDISTQSRAPCTEEYSTLIRNQLIQHAKIIGVDSF